MNRYPWWKYLVIVVAILLGALYTAPNYFGESPALQVTSGKVSARMDGAMVGRVAEVLEQAKIPTRGIVYDGGYSSVLARFADTDTQFRAKAVLELSLIHI